MEQPSILLSLPVEIWYSIVEAIPDTEGGKRCRIPTLYSLCLTSGSFNELFRSRLYSHIDLSMHTTGYTPEISSVFAITQGRYRDRSYWPDSFRLMSHKCFLKPRIAKRQESFLITVLNRPDFSNLVSSLTWTLFFGPELDEEGKAYDLETRALWEVGTRPLLYPHTETWTVFSRLKNVVNLDLASLNFLYGHEYVRHPPTNLFPRASSIKLAGWMGHETARSILWGGYGELLDIEGSSLSSLPARNIRLLELNNLQHYGTLPDGKPVEGFDKEDYLEPFSLEAIASIDRNDITSLRRLCGTLTGILEFPFTRYCTHLTDLTLRRASITLSEGARQWDEELRELAEDVVYEEWTCFVLSIRSILQRFRFEEEGATARNRINRKHPQKIVSLFFQPLFFSASKPADPRSMWPSLKILEIRLDSHCFHSLKRDFPEVVIAFEQLGGHFEKVEDLMSFIDVDSY